MQIVECKNKETAWAFSYSIFWHLRLHHFFRRIKWIVHPPKNGNLFTIYSPSNGSKPL